MRGLTQLVAEHWQGAITVSPLGAEVADLFATLLGDLALLPSVNFSVPARWAAADYVEILTQRSMRLEPPYKGADLNVVSLVTLCSDRLLQLEICPTPAEAGAYHRLIFSKACHRRLPEAEWTSVPYLEAAISDVRRQFGSDPVEPPRPGQGV